jgi:ketosteroid isomerase-like protein
MTVEAGGVGEEEWWTVAAQIMDGNVDAVGGANAEHGKILAMSGPPPPAGGLPSLLVPPSADDRDDVLAANEAFYAAFEQRDLDAMSNVWDHADRVVCTHPGWLPRHGWGAVAASWFALFTNGQNLQFILTDEQASTDGELGWVSCIENILGDGSTGGSVAALNVFVREQGVWKLVAHHGSSVATRG